MNNFTILIEEYIEYCFYRKRLNPKTLKAYRIDLYQYAKFSNYPAVIFLRNTLDCYVTSTLKQYKPKTAKRKIASLKAFFNYLYYKELLLNNPFDKLNVHFREPKLFPRTIPFHSICDFISILYQQKELSVSEILLLLNFYLQLEYESQNYVL